MLKAAGAIHDLALAVMAGGIAGVGLAMAVTFARAPSREIAGQIGNAVFGILGPAVLTVSLVALATRIYVHGAESPSAARSASLVLAIVTVLLGALLALWLTPRMGTLWTSGAHGSDGSGLAGKDRMRFLRLHGVGNLLYLAILTLSVAQIVLSSVRKR